METRGLQIYKEGKYKTQYFRLRLSDEACYKYAQFAQCSKSKKINHPKGSPVNQNKLVDLSTNSDCFSGLRVCPVPSLRLFLPVLPVHDLLHDVVDALGSRPLAAHCGDVSCQVLQPSQLNMYRM